MTSTQRLVREFLHSGSADTFREIFQLLESFGLQPLGKSNTKTLLYQHTSGGVVSDVLAFRLGPPRIISFPQSYWLSRASEMNDHLSSFSYSERPATQPRVSDSQFSAAQVEVSRSTRERLTRMCGAICQSIQPRA